MAKFQIQTGHWTSNVGTQGMSLTIEDAVSGLPLASIRLTPEQAYDLMRGAHISVEGEQTPDLSKIGKRMVHESFDVPPGVLDVVNYDEWESTGERWARANHPGWDSYSARRSNSGTVRVIVRKWVPACESTDPDAGQCELAAGHSGNHANDYVQWGREETAVCNACGWHGSEDDLPEGQVCPKCGQDEVNFFTPGSE